MVNVNAPLPLNLHNQRFASSRAHYHHTHSRPDESGGTSSASGSRSASLSNSRNAENTYNNYSTVTATRSSALIYNSLAMDSRSPSRSSSRAGGLDGEDGMVEYLGGRDDEEESGSREVGAQGVILNVRLVDGMGARDQSQARWGRASTRGRSPGRAKGKDRDGDDDEGNVRSEEGELESTPRPFALPQTSRDLSPGESPMPMLPSPETPRPLKNPTSNVLEQPSKGDPGAFSFEIKDTGELAMSWGLPPPPCLYLLTAPSSTAGSAKYPLNGRDKP